MTIDPVELTKKLVQCPSITPKDEGALDILQQALESLGFNCTRLLFEDTDTPNVDNLYARRGTGSPHFCYAGHTDVVPVGALEDWQFGPFDATVEGGVLYGRGTSDMKGGISAFVAAVSEIKNDHGSISLLITGDEEGPAINGTVKMLDWLKENGEIPDICLVGEPTNVTEIGDMAKIGRRGSLNGTLTIHGTQGHVAYPDLADNPIPRLVRILDKLISTDLDQGNEFFQPSNLEVVSIDVGNQATNVIPMDAAAKFNIRFNNEHTADELIKWIKDICDSDGGRHTLDIKVSGDAFLTEEGTLSELIRRSIYDVTGKNVELSTSGGTSDARFIKNYCPVAEFGLVNKTIHKVNECVDIDDLYLLKDIYIHMLNSYFAK
ncbi:MAG: succinyl-diaminopimelate desuccinylase [Alphaproteobacteria bacterium]|nr:succinyl-diaminopimelate desuccinylase [Alphaproteobacteria bacterium]HPF46905.1 succinyl-diaminopimelate desuccinylase [Emcibacteraceae bacterium]HRW29172.1 succinyl-diaminopimelate desuccinylase [Emcibacteraceae bacterium]